MENKKQNLVQLLGSIQILLTNVDDVNTQKLLLLNAFQKTKKIFLSKNLSEKNIKNLGSLEAYAKYLIDSAEFLKAFQRIVKESDENEYEEFIISLKKNVEDLIKEHLLEIEKEASASGPLGKWAFPNNRINKKMPYEPDTELERKLFLSIMHHFNDSNSKISKDVFDTIVNLTKSNQYSDVFKFFQNGPIYRAMIVDEEYADQLEKNDNMIYKPYINTYTSSWSKSAQSAYSFVKYGSAGSYAIILTAHPEENDTTMWIDAEEFYNLSQSANSLEHEKEVIVGGDVKVKIKNMWEM